MNFLIIKNIEPNLIISSHMVSVRVTLRKIFRWSFSAIRDNRDSVFAFIVMAVVHYRAWRLECCFSRLVTLWVASASFSRHFSALFRTLSQFLLVVVGFPYYCRSPGAYSYTKYRTVTTIFEWKRSKFKIKWSKYKTAAFFDEDLNKVEFK